MQARSSLLAFVGFLSLFVLANVSRAENPFGPQYGAPQGNAAYGPGVGAPGFNGQSFGPNGSVPGFSGQPGYINPNVNPQLQHGGPGFGTPGYGAPGYGGYGGVQSYSSFNSYQQGFGGAGFQSSFNFSAFFQSGFNSCFVGCGGANGIRRGFRLFGGGFGGGFLKIKEKVVIRGGGCGSCGGGGFFKQKTKVKMFI